MSVSRLSTILALAALAAATAFPAIAAATAGPKLTPEAEYQGEGTALAITAAGDSVTISRLPVHQQCKGETPTNLGDYGDPGLGPFTVEKDGSFTNASNGATIKGRFAKNSVSGTVVEEAFKDKGFDCSKYTGKFSAELVKGSGLQPGKVLARDDFSDPNSGFVVYNDASSYAEYLADARFRVGVRSPTTAVSLRSEPTGLTTVEVAATTLTFGGTADDRVGVVCQGLDPGTFTAGAISQGGVAQLARFASGAAVEQSKTARVPDGLLATGSGAKNTVDLTCRELSGGRTELTLKLNGTKVVSTISSEANRGQTGVLVVGTDDATQYNFTNFIARVPKASSR